MPPIPTSSKKEVSQYADKNEVYRLQKTDEELAGLIKKQYRVSKQIIKSEEEIIARVEDTEGSISEITVSIDDITQRVSTAEGNISTLSQTALSLTARISDAEGNISTLSQTSQSLTTRISDAEGDISTLSQTANSISLRVGAIEGDYVKSAEISMMVTHDADGYISSGIYMKADNINFKTGNFVIKNNNDETTLALDSNGNLTISGMINGASVLRYGTGDGIRLTSTGLERWNATRNAWVPLYAGRCVRFIINSNETLNADDDFIMATLSTNSITLPSNCSTGKVITIKAIGRTINIRPSTGQYIYTDHAISALDGGMDLNNYDRAEFVLNENYWYWNAISI